MMIKALRAAVLIGAAALGWFARSVFDDLRTSAADIGAYLDDVAGPLTEPPAETPDQLRAFEARYADAVKRPQVRLGPGGNVEFVGPRVVVNDAPERLDMQQWVGRRRRRPGPPL